MSNTSLNLSEETHERLQDLSDHFNKDINEIVSEIVGAISDHSYHIIRRSEEYKVPVNLTALFYHIFDTANLSTDSLFNKLLDEIGAKGYFIPSDMETDLDETRIQVNYDSVDDTQIIDSISVELQSHLWSIYTTSFIEIDETNRDVARKMCKIIDGETIDELVPEDFYNCDRWNVDTDSDEDYVRLIVFAESEYLSYLPKIPTLSSFYQKVYEKAGIKPTNTQTP